jgi:hypothetical protein
MLFSISNRQKKRAQPAAPVWDFNLQSGNSSVLRQSIGFLLFLALLS